MRQHKTNVGKYNNCSFSRRALIFSLRQAVYQRTHLTGLLIEKKDLKFVLLTLSKKLNTTDVLHSHETQDSSNNPNVIKESRITLGSQSQITRQKPLIVEGQSSQL